MRIGGGTDIDSKTTDVLRQNELLEDQVSALQLQLNTLRNERENEYDGVAMQLREDNMRAVREMTDKVLNLEGIIDDMKESHAKEIELHEKSLRDQQFESNEKDKRRIEELEASIAADERAFELEVAELTREHKKVVEELRLFYEKEIGDNKTKRSASGGCDSTDGVMTSSRRSSTDQSTSSAVAAATKHVKQEMQEKHEQEIDGLRKKFDKDRDVLKEQQEREISDIRTQYDEKLKMGYKEGLRRQSVSERRSDGSRIKELTTQKESAEVKFTELQKKYDQEVKSLESRNTKLQNLVSELKSRVSGSDLVDSLSGLGSSVSAPASRKGSLMDTLSESDSTVKSQALADEEAQKKLKEIQEQIERYERRIEYYREKSQRENTEESHRVSELKSEIVELHKELNNINEHQRKQEQKRRERGTILRKCSVFFLT